MLKEIVDLVSNYGFPIICSAIILLIFIKDNEKKSECLYDLLETYIDNNTKFHDSKEDIKYDKLYETISDTAGILRSECNAARVIIFMYHNGGKNLVGIPFQKMSCISESVAPGLATIADLYQNVHRGLFPTISIQLKNNNGIYYSTNIKSIMKKDPNLYNTLLNRSITSFFISAIYDSNENVIGYMQLEYISQVELLDKDRIINFMSESSLKISGIMEVIANENR